MRDVVETKLLEYDKSNFILELIQNYSNLYYVEIVQSIQDEDINRKLKINPNALADIIKVLQNFHAKIEKKQKVKELFYTEKTEQEIIKRYFKGISVKDLALQFDSAEELIEMILRNNDIVVMPNQKPNIRFRYKK